MRSKTLSSAIVTPLESLEGRRLFAAAAFAVDTQCDTAPAVAPAARPMHVDMFRDDRTGEDRPTAFKAFATSDFAETRALRDDSGHDHGEWTLTPPNRQPHGDFGRAFDLGGRSTTEPEPTIQIGLPHGDGGWTVLVIHDAPAPWHDQAEEVTVVSITSPESAPPPTTPAGSFRVNSGHLGPALVQSPGQTSPPPISPPGPQQSPAGRTASAETPTPSVAFVRAAHEVPAHAVARDQAGADVQVQTVADGRGTSPAGRVGNEPSTAVAQPRIAILPDSRVTEVDSVRPAEASASTSQDPQSAAPAARLAVLARAFAGQVEAVGRVLGAMSQPGLTAPSPDVAQWADMAATGSVNFLGLAPLRILSTEESGGGWRITAGISLVVTAVGYWYCQTNPMQIRKRKAKATVIAALSPVDRDVEFPAVS